MTKEELNMRLLDESQEVPSALEVFNDQECMDHAIVHQKLQIMLEEGELVDRKRMTRAVRKADPRYKVSRKWLRGQLLATGKKGPREIEWVLNWIRKYMGYKKYWQRFGPMIIWDQDAYRENCRRARMHGSNQQKRAIDEA